jgi:hypothetical protein
VRPIGHEKLWFHTINIRDLIYSVFLSADGNFHQQLRLGVKDQGEDPSYFGDAGFFVPTKLYQDYMQVAESLKSDDKVCGQSLRDFV